MNTEAKYETLIREIQDSMGKGKAWGTRVLRNNPQSLYVMYNFLRFDQGWEKRSCTREERKKWRHEFLMYAPIDALKIAAHRWADKSHTDMANSYYYKLVMTDLEKAFMAAYMNLPVEKETLTEYQLGRCAIAKLSLRD
jgi:hypothetical protein